MQVLGGYGYLKEYFLEQCYRDVRITAIYEGANAIHERALTTRLLPGKESEAFEEFLRAECLRNDKIYPQLGEVVANWCRVRDRVLQSEDPTALAHDFMKLTSKTLLKVLWARMAEKSDLHPDPERIRRLAVKVLERPELALSA